MGIDISKAVPVDTSFVPNLEPRNDRQVGQYILHSVGTKAFVPVTKEQQEQLTQQDAVSNSPVFIVYRATYSVEIARHLFDRGVPVENLTKTNPQFEIPLEDNQYFSPSLGKKTFSQRLEEVSQVDRPKLLRNLADTVGKINLNGVLYGANHLNNAVCGEDDLVSFVDFTSSSFHQINWENISDIDCKLSLGVELNSLITSNLLPLGCSSDEIVSTVKAITTQYPISEEKRQIVEKIALGNLI